MGSATNTQELAREALRLLERSDAENPAVDLRVPNVDESAHLPAVAVRAMRDVLANLAAGRDVAVVPEQAELTTQQAADMLGVSRPYLIKLLNEGVLEHRKVGRHRRVPKSAVLAYRSEQTKDARVAADELAALSDELGLY